MLKHKNRAMSVRTDLFPEAMIRAVDVWQAGSKDKARKARSLKERTRHLPDSYRRSPTRVFRQVRVNALLAIGVALDAIPEAISSWTTSEQVARHFRESDQDRSKVLMIFARAPDPDDVILNLEVLYGDPDFLETVSATSSRLGRSFRGIDRWQGTQKEVVLRETAIANDEIISLGAYRQLSDITPLIGTRDLSAESDDEIFRRLTGTAVTEHFWTSPQSASQGVKNAAAKLQSYLQSKRLWPRGLADA